MIKTLIMAAKMTIINILRAVGLGSLAAKLDQRWAARG
jgi:hypothetical protein